WARSKRKIRPGAATTTFGQSKTGGTQMKREATVVLLFVTLYGAPAYAQVAVTDPANTAVAQAHLSLMQLHTTFMKLQMVQDFEVLKNSYLQGKQYYDYVNTRSQHRGGLMGFYR